MKKILFMVNSLNIGGVEKSLISLLSQIPKYKYDITILVLDKKGGFLKYVPDWINVEEVSGFKSIKRIILQSPHQTIKDYYNDEKYFKIITYIYSYFLSKYTNDRDIYYKNIFKDIPYNSNEYDVAISYQGPTDIMDYYIVNKVSANKKISWIHFDISKFPINTKLYTKIYKKIDKIYVVSEEAKEKLVKIIPIVQNKAEVFLNIVSENLISRLSKESIKYDDFDGIKIVTVGRLSKEKGQDIGINVLNRLINCGYDLKWYCIGEGRSRCEYENLISKYNLENKFILVGETANPYPYILNSDIYVQTSRHEGYCLALAEARALNKPIVTTNFTGAYEQIENKYNGLIVNVNEDMLYENIKYLLDNPQIRTKFSTRLKYIKVDTTDEIYKLLNYIEE